MFETLVDTDDILLKLQWFDGAPYVHCRVYRWSPKVARNIYTIWGNTLNVLHKRDIPMVFSLIPTDDPKLRKFQEMYGMTEHSSDGTSTLFYRMTGE